LLKPNLKELREGMKTEVDATDLKGLTKTVANLVTSQDAAAVMVTLSEHGIFIADKHDCFLAPAIVRTISDVSGAGDTVISVAALCLAAGMPLQTIALMANLAGGQVCEKVGVVPVDRKILMEEASAVPELVLSGS
jgi:bifunctional ADP-heptose synthase (sugar kinase/adenylyltransferase)